MLLLSKNEAGCLTSQHKPQCASVNYPQAMDRSANYRASGLVHGRRPGGHSATPDVPFLAHSPLLTSYPTALKPIFKTRRAAPINVIHRQRRVI